MWSGAWGRDLAQVCSKSLQPIEMCSYIHACFFIRLVGSSSRPVADQRRVHSPQDQIVLSSAHNCTAIGSKLVFMVEHNYAGHETGEVDLLTPCSCFCCLPPHWQPRVHWVVDAHLCY